MELTCISSENKFRAIFYIYHQDAAKLVSKKKITNGPILSITKQLYWSFCHLIWWFEYMHMHIVCFTYVCCNGETWKVDGTMCQIFGEMLSPLWAVGSFVVGATGLRFCLVLLAPSTANLPKRQPCFLVEVAFEVSVALGVEQERKLTLGWIFLTFEEHLVSLSVADCTVNSSLTTSRACFHRHNIWPRHLITTKTEENSLLPPLCSWRYTLLSSSQCLQNATVNVAQMLYLWETQRPGISDRPCFPNSTVLSEA